jgi:hypothetical protein
MPCQRLKVFQISTSIQTLTTLRLRLRINSEWLTIKMPHLLALMTLPLRLLILVVPSDDIAYQRDTKTFLQRARHPLQISLAMISWRVVPQPFHVSSFMFETSCAPV